MLTLEFRKTYWSFYFKYVFKYFLSKGYKCIVFVQLMKLVTHCHCQKHFQCFRNKYLITWRIFIACFSRDDWQYIYSTGISIRDYPAHICKVLRRGCNDVAVSKTNEDEPCDGTVAAVIG